MQGFNVWYNLTLCKADRLEARQIDKRGQDGNRETVRRPLQVREDGV